MRAAEEAGGTAHGRVRVADLRGRRAGRERTHHSGRDHRQSGRQRPATSSGFGLKSGEAAAIVSPYKNPSGGFSTGVTVNGVKYTMIKADERSIYGKRNAAGAVLVRTRTSVLIGVHDGTRQPGHAAFAVEKLGDHLIDNGYWSRPGEGPEADDEGCRHNGAGRTRRRPSSPPGGPGLRGRPGACPIDP